MKKDIQTKQDIQLLVNSFYDKVKGDPVIGYIFTDAIRVNWEKHLPVMYSFWENILFYTGGYEGNPLEVHKHIHQLVPLTAIHFEEWIRIFTGTVDELFEGEKAQLAKQRAISVATVMRLKIIGITDNEL